MEHRVALEHRGVHRQRGCRRVGSACLPVRGCFHLCEPVRLDDLVVRGCPVVAEHRCRGVVEQASQPTLAAALASLGGLQVWQHLRVSLEHPGVRHPLQAATGRRNEQRSVVSRSSRELGDWVQQPVAVLVWPTWAWPGALMAWPLPGVLAEGLVSRPVSAC